MSTQLLLASNNLISQKKGTVVSDMDGSKVMLSISQGKYYNLGSVGGEIWDLMDSPITIEDIVEQLLTTYNIEKETCQKQVIEFINNLLTENLIVVNK